jgi:hypothetical protein
MRKECFPSRRKGKLDDRGDGPFKVLRSFGPNAYELELPPGFGVSAMFNVADLSPFIPPDLDIDDTGTCRGQEGEYDKTPDSTLTEAQEVDLLGVRSQGPITRSRARAISQATQSIVLKGFARNGTQHETTTWCLATIEDGSS